MRFEFNPSQNSKSFNEFIKYIIKTSCVNKMFDVCTKIPILIIFFLMITSTFITFYDIFFTFIILLTISITIIVLIITVILKLNSKRKAKKVSFTPYCDVNSIFYFTIENDYLIRKNEFSTIKLALSEISKIELLKGGLVLTPKNNSLFIFIPKDCLPVSLNQFLDLFKNKSEELIVLDYMETMKKRKRINVIIAVFIITLSIISSFFIGKYIYENNFTTYNLITENELTRKDFNETYFYENNNLGIDIYFPMRWNGHYGIEECDNKINIYYLPEGKQSNKTTLLFTVTKASNSKDNDDFNIIRFAQNPNGFYYFLSPKKIHTLKNDSAEYKEYVSMFNDIQNLYIN